MFEESKEKERRAKRLEENCRRELSERNYFTRILCEPEDLSVIIFVNDENGKRIGFFEGWESVRKFLDGIELERVRFKK